MLVCKVFVNHLTNSIMPLRVLHRCHWRAARNEMVQCLQCLNTHSALVLLQPLFYYELFISWIVHINPSVSAKSCPSLSHMFHEWLPKAINVLTVHLVWLPFIDPLLFWLHPTPSGSSCLVWLTSHARDLPPLCCKIKYIASWFGGDVNHAPVRMHVGYTSKKFGQQGIL